MLRRVPTWIIALAALGAVGLDLAVVGPLAHGVDEIELPPEALPMGAFLTGPVVERATLDGVEVEVREGKRGAYTLALTNLDGRAHALHLDVRTQVTEGSAVSRMLPFPVVVASQRVAVVVPAEATVLQPLDYRDEGPSVEDLGPLEFRTVEFALFPADEGAGDEVLARLQVASGGTSS